MVGFQEINLDPGQFIFGRKKAAIELDTTERKIRTSLDSLVKSKNVTIKSTNKFSIISIINWHIYQDENFTNDQLIRQPPTSNRPATDQQPTTELDLQSYRVTEKNKTHTSSDATDDPSERCPHSEIIALYHNILSELPRIKEWTPSRQALLRSRWNEKAERRNLAWWESFFRAVKESDFLTGRAKEFRADLEWLVRPKNFPKVIEGRYANVNQASSSDSEPEEVKAARRRLACQKMNF